MPALLGVAVVLLVVFVVLLVTDAGDGDPDPDPDPGPVASGTATSPVTSSSVPASSIESTTSTSVVANTTTTAVRTTTTVPTTTSTAPVVVDGTVARTCGADGGGDCFVALRAAPSADSAELGRLAEGAAVRIECQVEGDAAYSSVLDRESPVWARTPTGAYLAAVFVDAPGLDPFRVTTPCAP